MTPEPTSNSISTATSTSWRLFLARWAVHTVAVLVATQIVPGIECRSWTGLLTATLLLGLLNAFVRPLLLLLSLPIVVLTLGLFLWVINAALLYFVGWLVKPFQVAGFASALGGAAVISIVATLLGAALGVNTVPARSRYSSPQSPGSGYPRRRRLSRDDDDNRGGGGPVIDV
ncbi:MAG: phage holin family protein [Limisphaerales bacterium]